MVVGGLRKRHQQCGLASGGEFGNGAGSAARQDQRSLGETLRHVIKKRGDAPARLVRAAGLIGLLGGFGMACSGLVQNGQARHGGQQFGGSLRHVGVEDARALAASKNKQLRRLVRRTRRKNKELLADWDAGDLSMAKILRGGREVHCRRVDALANEPVGEAGNCIGLEGQRGNAQQLRGQHGRTGGVAADADHCIGAVLPKHPHAAHDAQRKIEQGAYACEQRDVVELPDFDERERITGLRHEL